jgi:hypothetical protein
MVSWSILMDGKQPFGDLLLYAVLAEVQQGRRPKLDYAKWGDDLCKLLKR